MFVHIIITSSTVIGIVYDWLGIGEADAKSHSSLVFSNTGLPSLNETTCTLFAVSAKVSLEEVWSETERSERVTYEQESRHLQHRIPTLYISEAEVYTSECDNK